MRRLAVIAVAVFAFSSCASAYYHFTHFLTHTAPFVPVPEKFDLSRLPANTIQYFISDNGPSAFAPGDSFPALTSEIRLAASAWNNVATSDLRVAFGGLVASGTIQNGPAIDVTFDDDIAPGIVAYGGPTALGNEFVKGSNGSFAPITHSVLRIRRDLTGYPSYGEDLFLTLVHELGHALGLQHTFTSSVMSTAITRGTTKYRPLAADDIAGLSVLYPSSGFAQSTASISGKVTMNGSGVNLASVVAIPPAGMPVSALTNPDGTYVIRGIPPGQPVYVYVHPLPPPLAAEVTPGNVVPPKDPDGNPIPASGYFGTQFFPGTRDVARATVLTVSSGEVHGQVDFDVQPVSAPDLSSVTTYGYVGSNAVHPGPVTLGTNGAAMVATGTGLLSGTDVAAGLGISTLGGARIIPASVRYYTGSYLAFAVAPVEGDTPGVRHLIFSTPNDLYVLPAAFQIVSGPPPSVTSAVPALDDSGNRAALISGSNLSPSTLVYFDGNAGTVLRQNSDGSILTSTPAGPSGYRANVTAYNTEGLSSLYTQPVPPTFGYEFSAALALSFKPQALTAGTDAMLEITGMNFADGQVSLGFGSNDIVVRRVWVKEPGRLWANIRIGPSVPAGQISVTVAVGLATVGGTIQVLPAAAGTVAIQANPVNTMTGGPGIWPGVVALIPMSNLPGPASNVSLTVGDQKAQILSASSGALTFQVPQNLPPGPAVLRLTLASGDAVAPVVVQIDPVPPMILGVNGAEIKAGSNVTFAVAGIDNANAVTDPSTIRFSFGGRQQAAASVTESGGMAHIGVTIPADLPAGQVAVTVTYNGLTSPAYYVSVSK